MRRWLGWIAIGGLLLLCAVALAAYGSSSRPASLDDRARAVEQQLRCPSCQGESVADSPSDIAKAMRVEIRQDLAHGESSSQVETFFVQRYGDWILLAPPASGVGRFAWLAPPLLLLIGLGLLVTSIAGWRGRGAAAGTAGEQYLARVRAELAAEPE
ncbi:MAG: cytochrome c-type biogenesis protein CcmH [Chloroflexota bacterium]|nr:cytochrome c-type biogenesis protein CcmH [Chloroflexota bacterium]